MQLSVLNVSSPQACNFAGVIPEIDIWRAVNLMLKRYGEKALEESEARADELAAADDYDGVAVWRRIRDAVVQLANTTHPARCIDRKIRTPASAGPVFMFCTSTPTTENFSRELKNFSSGRPRALRSPQHYWDTETRHPGQNVNMRLREIPPAPSVAFRDNSADPPESGKPDSQAIGLAPTNYLFSVVSLLPSAPGLLLKTDFFNSTKHRRGSHDRRHRPASDQDHACAENKIE
jgi:hypothetical protein